MGESRIENQLDALINGTTYSEPPGSRTEAILQSIIDDTEYTEPPESRIEEKLLELKEVIETGEITVESLNVTSNGTYSAPTGKAYSPVSVDVPNSYTQQDEGKVVDNGALMAQTARTVTANGTYDTTKNNSVTVDVPVPQMPIYGYHIDYDTKDISYVAANQNFTPAAMGAETFSYGDWEDAFFMPKPCMLKYDGTVDYYLNPNDYSKKLDGTASDYNNINYGGNCMIQFPKIFYKFVPDATPTGGTFYCSNYKPDNDFDCMCNYDANDNEIPYFYIRAFNGIIIDGKMRSIAGYALTNANGAGDTTGQQEIDAATANNTTTAVEWYTSMISDHFLITHLLTLIGKGLDHQSIFGRGLDSGGQVAKEAYITGTLIDKGTFWGDTANGNSGMKVFGIENFYACSWTRCAGLIGTATGYKYKLTHGTHDGSTANTMNTTGNGWIELVVDRPSANNHLINLTYTKAGSWFPKTSGPSADSKYKDYTYIGNGYVLIGGSSNSSNSGAYAGSWYVALYNSVAVAAWSVSSSLSCKPRA